MELKQLQRVEFDILEFVHDFCVERDYTYWLFYGTLLGAVRHQGFIPWDDDLDIAMPREDYERFLKEFQDPSGRYQVISCADPGYIYPFAKVVDTKFPIREKSRFDCCLGIYIDIFPIDTVPEEEKKRKKLISKLWKYGFFWSGAIDEKNIHSSNPARAVYSRLLTQRRTNQIVRAIDTLLKKTSAHFPDSSLCADGFSVKRTSLPVFRTSDCRPVLGRFENRDFFIPKGADAILKVLYSDYMQLPKPEDRHPAHAFAVLEENESSHKVTVTSL